jgi:D-beta-D-heptose 7-phosphate kinase/D-beta-D-heptose 1-phosphate adenosyltransferase
MCGFDGATFFHVPGNRVKAVDAVGCGDTVRAGLALGIACGLPLPAAAELANDAAAVIVQRPATAFLSQDELIAFIKAK